MKQRLKLIFYIVSALILGFLTIFQIISVRNTLVTVSANKLDQELNEVKNVVNLWKNRKPFDISSIQIATPSANVSPTKIQQKETPSSVSGQN